MRKLSPILCLLFFSVASFAQTGQRDIPPALQRLLSLQQATYTPATQSKTTQTTTYGPVFDPSQWNHRVDSTWGAGIATADKLSMFNRIWASIDSTYSGFVHLPLYNWDSLVNDMRNEISGGVSRGRFAAILNRLAAYLNDAHTGIFDPTVNYSASIYPRLPVMRPESGLFGACVTMLPDSSAMVYSTRPGHVFGLQPGDIILGYNNVAWKDLVTTILEYQLPNTMDFGSTEAATYHKMIAAAGENWYLFDTINIRKCDGSLVNFPTSLMVGTGYNSFCTEQLQVPGVPKPTLTQLMTGISVSSGLITGTSIGYVYMLDCSDMTGNQLYNAVRTLVEDSLAQSLIFDLRTNYGGTFTAFRKTYTYLADGSTSWVGYASRPQYNDRYLMANTSSSSYDVLDQDIKSFSKPIAILCGPGAASAGDFFQVLFKHHPSVRTFGKSTAGAFGGYQPINTGQAPYQASKQLGNFYEVSDPSHYLTHMEYPVDYPIWFDQNSVCAGNDNIVAEAVSWINGQLNVPQTNADPEVMIYPNPSSGYLNIAIKNVAEQQVTVRVFNMQGVLLQEHSEYISAPVDKVEVNAKGFPNGNYYLAIEGLRTGKIIRKFTLIE